MVLRGIDDTTNYITPDVQFTKYEDVKYGCSCDDSSCEHKKLPSVLYDIHKLRPLCLAVEPSEFVINPEKGTKFSIKCLSIEPQDVIVTVHSFLFEIKNARRKIGMTSQFFHVMKKDETKEFEVVMRDSKDESMENFVNSPYDVATGVLEITHYKSRKDGSSRVPKVEDSDAEWGIKGSEKLIRTASCAKHYQGYWKGPLLLAEPHTEAVKQRKKRFAEIRIAELTKSGMDYIENMFKMAQPMFAKEEYPSLETERELEEQKKAEKAAKRMAELEEKWRKEKREEEEKEKKKWKILKLFKKKK